MAEQENPAFGRKIFILCPSFAMKNTLIARLIENEYETYVIEKHEHAKNVLRQYPDSICFINLDEDMHHESWYNFIKSCESDQTLSTILFGAISATINKYLRLSYMEHLKLKAGFIPNTDLESVGDTMEGILKANGAKGRRQYVRSSCANDENAIMLVQLGSKALKLDLLDISVVGTACEVDVSDKDKFTANEVLRNTTISLDKKDFTIDAVVYAVIQTENFCKLVLLFIQPVLPKSKQVIRGYISANLQKEIKSLENEFLEDDTDYSKAPS